MATVDRSSFMKKAAALVVFMALPAMLYTVLARSASNNSAVAALEV